MNRMRMVFLAACLAGLGCGEDEAAPDTASAPCLVGCWMNDRQGGTYQGGYPMEDLICLEADGAGYILIGGDCLAVIWGAAYANGEGGELYFESIEAIFNSPFSCDETSLRRYRGDSTITFTRVPYEPGCAGEYRPEQILGSWYATFEPSLSRTYSRDGSVSVQVFGDRLHGRFGERRGVLETRLAQIVARERWTVSGDTLHLENLTPRGATILFPARGDWVRSRPGL